MSFFVLFVLLMLNFLINQNLRSRIFTDLNCTLSKVLSLYDIRLEIVRADQRFHFQSRCCCKQGNLYIDGLLFLLST